MMSGPSTPQRSPPRVLLWLQDGVEADLLALQLRQAGLVVVAARSAEHVRNALSWAPADAFIVEVPPTRAADTVSFLKAQRTPSMALYAVTPPGGLDRATELKLFSLGCRDLWAAPLSAVAIAQQLLSGPAGAPPTSDAKAIKGLAGDFRYQPLTYVFQMCRRHRLNARLHARLGDGAGDDWAVLLLKGGEIVDAETPGLRGKAAAVEWLARAGQGFILHPLPPDAPELQRPDVVQEDIARLLMRAQHRRGGSAPPAVAALPVAQVPQAMAAMGSMAATEADHVRPGRGSDVDGDGGERTPGAGGGSQGDQADDVDATQLLSTRPTPAASAEKDAGRGAPSALTASTPGRREGTAPGVGAPASRRTAAPRPAPLEDAAATAASVRPTTGEDPDVVDDRTRPSLREEARPPAASRAEADPDEGPQGTRRKETADGLPGAVPSAAARASVKRAPRRGKREGERTDETPREEKEIAAASEARQAFRRGPRRSTAPGGPRRARKDQSSDRGHDGREAPRLTQEALDALQEAESTEMAAPPASRARPPRHGADLAATLERRGPLSPSERGGHGRDGSPPGDEERGGVWVNPRSGLIHVGKVRAQPEPSPAGAEDPADRPRVKVRHMRQVDTPPPSHRAPRPSPPSSGPSTRPGARPAPPRTPPPAEGTDGGFEVPRLTPHPLAVAGWIALIASAVAIFLLASREPPEPPPPSALSVASERFAAGDRKGVESALMPRFRAGEASSVELRLLADAMLANGRPHAEVRPVVEALVALSPSDTGATAWLAAFARSAGDEAAFGRHLERAEFLAPGDAGVQRLRASAR